jgi:hypothetical protein
MARLAWYARPDGVAGEQYWDGQVWTDRAAPVLGQ